MSVVYYLSVALMLVTGHAAPTISYPYDTKEECLMAAQSAADALEADAHVKEFWITGCDPTEFSDFTPEEAPHTEHSGEKA